MLKNDREQFIMNYLKEKETVKVKFLSDQLEVTPETIRRDLDDLESRGKITRVHGGAISNNINLTETNFTVRETIKREEKEAIAYKACSLINEGDFIALDVSTTNTEIAKKLVHQFKKLSIITNSLTIAQVLSANSNFDVFLPSGRLRNSELCIVGASAIQYISQFHIDVFFMSASGISIDQGITDNGFDEFEVKKAMLVNALNVFVVADSSKFGLTSRLLVDNFEKVNGIITDPGLETSLIANYESHGIQIFHV